MTELRRPPPSRPRRRGIKVAVLFNVDYEDATPDGDPGYVARAEVGDVASQVSSALSGAYEVTEVPVDGDLSALRQRLTQIEPDCVFNLCESLAGDARLESAVPTLLELMKVPFTGSSPEALSNALYKDRVKQRLMEAGVPTPQARVLRTADDPCDLPFPLIAKPVREDGSVGINARSVVWSKKELSDVVGEVTRSLRQPCLVEQYVDGREFNVSLIGFPTSRVLPLSEIDFSRLPQDRPRIVSYEAKWSEGSVDDLGTQPVLLPELPNPVAARVRKVAVEAFRAIGARDYGRVDVRLSSSGVPFVIDVNPNCDLAQGAGMARSAAAVGLDHAALVRLLVQYALRRRKMAASETRPLPRGSTLPGPPNAGSRVTSTNREETNGALATRRASQGASG